MNDPGRLSDMQIEELAIRFVLAMMRSASTDKIRPVDWWGRARAALEASAASADNLREMVSRFAKKCQIDTLTASSANSISSVDHDLGDREGFVAFRRLCERDAVFVVAMAQTQRALEKEAAQQPRPGATIIPVKKAGAAVDDSDLWVTEEGQL